MRNLVKKAMTHKSHIAPKASWNDNAGRPNIGTMNNPQPNIQTNDSNVTYPMLKAERNMTTLIIPTSNAGPLYFLSFIGLYLILE